MKIRQVTIHKEMKVGLPSFSNITASVGLTADIGEKEEINWDKLWDEVNRELSTQVTGIEPSWIQTREFNRFFKITMTIPKEEYDSRTD
jgi:hypothetical protein